VKTLVVLLLKTCVENFHDILPINQEEYIQIKFKNFKTLRCRRVKTQTEGGGSYLLEVEEDLKEMKKFRRFWLEEDELNYEKDVVFKKKIER
jgi:predicted transposase YbfD/YdcC